MMKEGPTREDILRAAKWFGEHGEDILKMINSSADHTTFPPSGDISEDPSRWKINHWGWFMNGRDFMRRMNEDMKND